MLIECENELCIYQKQRQCILSKIILNNRGCCESCIVVECKYKNLKKTKKDMLKRLLSLISIIIILICGILMAEHKILFQRRFLA